MSYQAHHKAQGQKTLLVLEVAKGINRNYDLSTDYYGLYTTVHRIKKWNNINNALWIESRAFYPYKMCHKIQASLSRIETGRTTTN